MNQLDGEAEARSAILRLVGTSARTFKVGRCGSSEFDGLKTRPEYRDAFSPVEVFRGTAAEADQMEKRLIAFAMEPQFGTRCTNQQFGGGGHANDAEHVVYLVRWPS